MVYQSCFRYKSCGGNLKNKILKTRKTPHMLAGNNRQEVLSKAEAQLQRSRRGPRASQRARAQQVNVTERGRERGTQREGEREARALHFLKRRNHRAKKKREEEEESQVCWKEQR